MTAVVNLLLLLGILVKSGHGGTELEPTNTPSPVYDFDKGDYGFYQCHNAPPTPYNTKAGVEKINEALKAMYDSITVKDADYEENCTYSLDLKMGQSDESAPMELALLFERFERLRSNLERKLWGYCAEQGVEYLLAEIGKVQEAIAEANDTNEPVRICDRSKLLGCHRKYNKCKCLVDNKNFRNIAAEYWNDTEKPKDEKIGNSQCVLVTGSDCNFLGHGDFRCIPGNKCRYKDNKKLCKLPRIGYEVREETTSPDYSFTNYKYSNIYCQCYSYYTTGASLIAPQVSWTLVAILLTKYSI